jgi:uncharacterized protein (TIGR03435 family)
MLQKRLFVLMIAAQIFFAVISVSLAQSFEVASIRLHTMRVQSVGSRISGPRLTVEAMSLDNLITYGYDLKNYQVSGAPSWADSNRIDCDRYDIAAKAEGDGTLRQDQAKAMVQALLADRFHLQFHKEMKEMPVYALVLAKNGPKLKESPQDAQILIRMGSGVSGTELTVTRGSMPQLVAQLSNNNGIDRPVLDKTQLTGNYDYKLTWTPELGAPRNDSVTLSIFTALQEQLGLRLDPQKAPIEILVIDHVEKPSEN